MYVVEVSDTTMMTKVVNAHKQKIKQTFKRNLRS